MLILRGNDSHGSGAFMASRGNRKHHGIDISGAPGGLVCPQLIGAVTKLGYPYAAEGMQHFRYVQVTDPAGNAHRYFYVTPLIELGDQVTLDTVVGIVQDRGGLSPGMGNHVHYEIIDKTGRYVNPAKFLGM